MAATVHYPVKVEATLDAPLSRWLWLVKWLLAIPHFIVLAFLWLAFFALSVVAFVAILVTGRYPRAIFDFNVGVLRWTWRVQYYAYGALGTDRYPPFTLAERADYPAHLEIAYPEHLSRGLVLVKWWLLAIPQYLIVGFFIGGGAWVAWRSGQDDVRWGGGLIGVLVVIAGIVLAFTGRYPKSIYDFVLGMNRWVLRVAAYAVLMTDRYPPFRMDMGGHEPGGTLTVSEPPEPPEPPPPFEPSAAGPAQPAPGAPPTAPSPSSGWTAGRIVALVIGSVLGIVSTGLLVAGGALLVLDHTHRDAAGYLGLGTRSYATDGYAVVSGPIRLDSPTSGWASLHNTVGTVRVTVHPTDPGRALFVGIAPSGAAGRYLRGTDRLVINDLEVVGLPRDTTHLAGGPPSAAPAATHIWVQSAQGTGTQTLRWKPTNGSWTIAVMNADGSATVDVRAQLAATTPALPRAGYVVLVTGLVTLAAATALVVVPVRRASV
ncbi:MAG: DUF4389 domain-containing protein [Actinomycetes bacterium]